MIKQVMLLGGLLCDRLVIFCESVQGSTQVARTSNQTVELGRLDPISVNILLLHCVFLI